MVCNSVAWFTSYNSSRDMGEFLRFFESPCNWLTIFTKTNGASKDVCMTVLIDKLGLSCAKLRPASLLRLLLLENLELCKCEK